MYTKQEILKKYSKELRKNMTAEERRLWYCFLRNLDVRFKRQKIIGEYIVDFYCAKAKLVIELDGCQHYTDEMLKADAIRDEKLGAMGLRVLRYTNLYFNQHFKEVCKDIWLYVYGEK